MAEESGQQQFEFEGLEVEDFMYKLGGKAISENVERVQVDDEVWFLIRAHVTGANHQRRKGIFTREQSIAVIGARRVDKDAEIADALIDEATQYLEDIGEEHPEKGDGEEPGEGTSQ